MTRNRALSFALFTFLAAPVTFAQQGPPTPPGPTTALAPPPVAPMTRTHGAHERGGGMGIVPPGTWWKNPDVVSALSLTPDQQKKLDDTFLQSRISLVHLHASLEEEQLKLEPLLSSNPPDQVRSLAQISKIADLRADLEKADARMLLSLRGVLTADQWIKLQAEQASRREGGREDRAPRSGPRGQHGPQSPGGPSPAPGPQGGDPNLSPPPAGYPAN